MAARDLAIDRTSSKQEPGHHRPFQAAVHQRGLEFRPVEGNPRELARPHVARLLADAVAACQDTQAIIYAPLGMAGYHPAQQQQVPSILAALVPLSPTRAFPAAVRASPAGVAVGHAAKADVHRRWAALAGTSDDETCWWSTRSRTTGCSPRWPRSSTTARPAPR